MGNPWTVQRLGEIRKSIYPDIIFLMETKNPNAFVLDKLKHLGYEYYDLVPPTGHGAGGLALFWKQEIKLEVLEANANLIDTEIEVEGNKFFASFVYGDTDKRQRKQLWEYLVILAVERDAPWFITGDFNDLLSNDEKTGGNERPEGSFADLRTFFAEGDLYDLQHTGDPLSWRGQRGDDLVRCRLDRAAANSSWAERFPTARCTYLAYEGSDHEPLISVFDPYKKKRRGIFRYDRRLKDNPEVTELIRETWRQAGAKPVADRISLVRGAISRWNKTKQNNSRLVIESKREELEEAQTSPINDTELINKISKELKAAYNAEEAYWRQRSRLLWLQLGDRNSGFFHATTKNRKRANDLPVIEDMAGNPVYKEDQIARVIVQYFNNLFTSSEGEREEVVNMALEPKVSDEENERLIQIPNAEEIRAAVFSIHADKAPGPDGFSAGFFHSNWDTIGRDIVDEIQDFFVSAKLPAKINETFVRLIPKVHSPQTVAGYRPIALCNVYYKIISKILTKRLQPLLSSIISETQSAFVPGRAISDNVLITHEVLHYLQTSKAEKICSMAVKTDMSKAYERLEWEFIQLVLERLGFHPTWVKWIMECVSSVTYAFLINGSPRGRVKPSRGIRQGDPLSPYIFILCGEVLSGLCNRAQESGEMTGVRVARGSPQVNHLLFADDTMFFTRANEESASALKTILNRYEAASGQSINTEKSSVTFSRKTPVALKTKMKAILNIQKVGGLGKYLGLPEHFGRKKKDLFSSIVDRIQVKASGWSNRHLSPAGKMVMLHSVLTPIPSYSMTCFKLPVSLCQRIQSALTRFWWGDKDGNRKMAWVSWDKMTQPKVNGGLNFKDFQSFNDAFLAKLSWRLIHNPSCLLSRVLMGKYCPETSFLQATHKSVESHGWRGLLIGRDLICNNSGWAVGNGKSIKIWSDAWLSYTEQARPMGPAPANQLDLTVDCLLLPDGSDWNREAIRSLVPHEESRILSIKPSRTGAPDKLIWLGTESGEYTTKSGYRKALERSTYPEEERPAVTVDWNSGVWKLHTAPKIKLFLWKIFRGALPVGESLAIRNITSALNCKRCNTPESTNHLFLHCGIAQKVWKLAPFSNCIDTRGMVDLAGAWPTLCKETCLPPTGITSGQLAPWILWFIWLARNDYVFNNKDTTPEAIITKATVAA